MVVKHNLLDDQCSLGLLIDAQNALRRNFTKKQFWPFECYRRCSRESVRTSGGQTDWLTEKMPKATNRLVLVLSKLQLRIRHVL